MIDVPHGARMIADRLAARGYQVVLVGGAVRDALLGRPFADVDFATDATPAQVRAVLEREPWLEALWDVGERFGTLGARAGGTSVEITTLRGAVEGPEEVTGAAPLAVEGSLAKRFAADASHRDLTVNAIGVAYPDGELLDPHGGRSDLDARLLRAVGDPGARFAEDPLRVLRVPRLVSQLGFNVEQATRAALAPAAPTLAAVAPERVREELTRLLRGDHPARGLRLAQETGALAAVLPEVDALVGLEQPTFHYLDAFEHTLATVEAAPRDADLGEGSRGETLRWAALLHDVGKAPTRTFEPGGRIRFFRHADVGAELAEELCVRLRFSKHERRRIVHLVERHMRFGDLDLANRRAVDRAVRRMDLWDEDSDPPRPLVTAEEVVELVAADVAATSASSNAPAIRIALLDAVAASRARGVAGRAAAPLSGKELMDLLGIDEGPAVGSIKEAMAQAVEEGTLSPDDTEAARELARRIADETAAD